MPGRRKGGEHALDERSRHQLYLRLEEALGAEAATTLMEHLPPVGWADVATKRDIDNLGLELRSEMHGLRAEFYEELGHTTRTVVFANLGAVTATATLAFAAARLT